MSYNVFLCKDVPFRSRDYIVPCLGGHIPRKLTFWAEIGGFKPNEQNIHSFILLARRSLSERKRSCYGPITQPICRSVCRSVCLSVGLSVLKVYCGKTAEWIRIPFGVVSGVGRGMGVLDRVSRAPRGKRGFGNFVSSLLWGVIRHFQAKRGKYFNVHIIWKLLQGF